MTIVLGSSIVVTTVATMSRSFFFYQEGLVEDMSMSGVDMSMSGVDISGGIPPSTTQTRDTITQGLTPLTPSLVNNIPNKDQMQKQLGKASEMEQAYDNLEKIMGKDNIQSISTDTKDLIKQQNELIKQLKTMTPALNDAMSSIGNLDLSKLTSMFSSATKTLSDMKAE
jgi:ABC-type transporter Mla subunit MlaD